MDENNLEALTQILTALKSLDKESQKRTLTAVITFLGLPIGTSEVNVQNISNGSQPTTSVNKPFFSENRTISPKEFLRDKSPKTDVERIVCLAYYLTHYRDTPHFKTVDLSSLNTEAAQPKLSNPAVAVENATRAGFLVQALKGSKQVSIAGETLVQALPDRDAAKTATAGMRVKRKVQKKKSNNSADNSISKA